MRLITLIVLLLLAPLALADRFQLVLEVPRMHVAEYHAPYLAFWVESPDHSTIVPLGLWYDGRDKWLKDLRQWWRRTGRSQQAPYDGLTGATRAPGLHELDFSDVKALQALPTGHYALVVEAAREVGGREVVRIPFDWPPQSIQKHSANGSQELGAMQLTLTPDQP
ncbi:hypothetical protein A11A3_01637 [Alcanivorax hongdengensis A-11-3]|uniref:DUF2271 domain-containing protein n=1 Tax=Alcanivorax hongdengensis A-11-3 TaxID=1177179 RepID=L0WFQ1_9GAMM|nr:DUF2271 domain-containing protein [Alcanivorax hongdengensis]EKF75534.1 hypothetical protein A11A3_01637 [Alcanivorax hongdengensis A-11-3]